MYTHGIYAYYVQATSMYMHNMITHVRNESWQTWHKKLHFYY